MRSVTHPTIYTPTWTIHATAFRPFLVAWCRAAAAGGGYVPEELERDFQDTQEGRHWAEFSAIQFDELLRRVSLAQHRADARADGGPQPACPTAERRDSGALTSRALEWESCYGTVVRLDWSFFYTGLLHPEMRVLFSVSADPHNGPAENARSILRRAHVIDATLNDLGVEWAGHWAPSPQPEGNLFLTATEACEALLGENAISW